MKQRIFVVEDDEPILDLMDIVLRKLGHEPVLVANGLLALEMIQREPPALILLDIMMTPIDGWEFLAKLREEYGRTEIPVIIFSASPAVEERMAQIHDPLLGVLHKPVSFSELREGIERYLGKNQ
jgi:CheY-like chemotaxis protein